LSSGVFKNPDFTMELLLEVVRKLRTENHFNGYIHLKVIPGASQELIRIAGLYADRVSVNIELPSEESLKSLAPEKKKDDIVKPMALINNTIIEKNDEKKIIKRVEKFAPAGQSTQMIVGATPESDLQIIKLSSNLYKKFDLKRVYYSAFIPVNKDNRLPVLKSPPLVRENRLYQADWLMRFYGFGADEILDDKDPFLDNELDPKTAWAVRNLHHFPIDVNKADYETILRIPGVGVRSAKKIVMARRFGKLDFEGLKKIGVVLKRARYFITCSGKYLENGEYNPVILREKLLGKKGSRIGEKYIQLKLFESY
jgi:putative DNA modification/repair radical SAM protein